jgi:hypothetical protein
MQTLAIIKEYSELNLRLTLENHNLKFVTLF